MRRPTPSIAILLCVVLLTGCGARLGQTDEINIDYPVFPEYSAEVNELIKETAYSALDLYDEDSFDSEQRLLLDIAYEVKMKEEDFVSVAFSGQGHIPPRSRLDHFFYTLNLDIKTGEEVRLADKASIDDAFANALHQAARETLNPESYELFRHDYIDCPYNDDCSFLQELASADAYFTPNTIGVILPIKATADRYYVIEIPR